jgi:type III restriction enzyme
LFDIVRLYESRSNVVDKKTGKIKVWPQTLSEAQLIGRWARYFPFITTDTLGEDKYKRKFDKTDHELKILETFFYHTSFDNLYITEIKQALREIWMMDEKKENPFPLKLKESFINTEFYKEWVIYTNERKEIWWEWINSLEKAGITVQRIPYSLMSWISDTIVVFDEENKQNNTKIAKEPRTILMKNIGKHIVRKAIWKNDFYKFDNLTKYLWELKSIDQFMSDDKYLWNIKIDFSWTQETLDNIDNEQLLQAVSFVLKQLEAEIKWKEIRYRGTKQFKPNPIQKIFKKEKDLFVEPWKEWFGVDKDWFVFEKIVWSSEEKAFVELFEKKIQELQKKYEDIYLIRSERAFPVYSFDKWERFEPDFILFMKEKKNKKPITYQVFIEPKWDPLLLVDKWKQDFLLEIDTNAEILDLNLGNYKLIGLPFYNRWLENEFERAMDEKLLG